MTITGITILGGILAATVAGVFAFLKDNKGAQDKVSKYFKSVEDEAKIEPILKALQGGVRLEELCNEFYKFPGVRKAVIVRVTNGGLIPVIGSPLYSSIVYPHVWAKTWNNQKLDPEYSKLVLNIYLNDDLHFDIDSLDKDGLLVGLFESQSVQTCKCHALKKAHDSFFFLAIDFYDESLVNIYVENEMRILINEINSIFLNGN